MIDRSHCAALDAADPLSHMRAAFSLPDDVIYLDGNSLGALPRSTAAHMQDVVTAQWGQDLIGSWNKHGWIDAPLRVGARIAPLIGAAPDEVLVADTTSINLFKFAAAALDLRPDRHVILSESGNFPTDLYMLQGLRDLRPDIVLRFVARDALYDAIDDSVALILLSHVHYKSGQRWNMAELTQQAHAKGALILWDLSHSTGAVALTLNADNVDFAVGCGYKFLNGGPGAPSFLFAADRHHNALRSPLAGWLGHATPFTFSDDFAPAPGIRRMLCSSPSILAIAALDSALALWQDIDLAQIEAKSGQLGDLFIALVEERCPALILASPRSAAQRGAHVSFAHPHGYAIMQALIARNVIGDFRAPDLLRFGFAPLYVRYTDVWHAATTLHDILTTGSYDEHQSVAAVT